jgi:C1A family cysteine protease
VSARTNAGYGWRPSLPDIRDQREPQASLLQAVRLPRAVSLRQDMPAVYDQGQLGSCTGNAIAAADEHQLARQHESFGSPSRLFIYYGEREIEGTVNEDAGAEIRDGFKVLAKLGAPPETDWPYDIAKFARKPPTKAYGDAEQHVAIRYKALPQHLTSFRVCLANGFPFVFGFTVYESFESDEVARTGVVPMPSPSEAVLGGHAVLAVGYDMKRRAFEVRNSWGESWGERGYCWMPFDYLLDPNLASDFWTFRHIT